MDNLTEIVKMIRTVPALSKEFNYFLEVNRGEDERFRFAVEDLDSFCDNEPPLRRLMDDAFIQAGYYEDTTDNPWEGPSGRPAKPGCRRKGRRYDPISGLSEWLKN